MLREKRREDVRSPMTTADGAQRIRDRGGRGGQAELHAAVANEKHFRIRRGGDGLGLEAEPERAVVVVAVFVGVAIREVAIELVLRRLTAEDAMDSQTVGARAESPGQGYRSRGGLEGLRCVQVAPEQ